MTVDCASLINNTPPLGGVLLTMGIYEEGRSIAGENPMGGSVGAIMNERRTEREGSVQAAAERFFADLDLRFEHDRPDCHSRACNESSTIPNGKEGQ